MEEENNSSLRALAASVAALREEVRCLAALISRKRSLPEEDDYEDPGRRCAEEGSSPSFQPVLSSPSGSPRNKKFKCTPNAQTSVEHLPHDAQQTTSYRGDWADLPEELLCALFAQLDRMFVGIAARTCRSWFYRHSPTVRSRLFLKAACSSSLELLRWAVEENGCPLNRDLSAQLAHVGKLDLLKWARGQGCPWNSKTCINAAAGGHLDVLKWVRKNGCDWDENCCTKAAKRGHLAVLQWLRAHGCLWTEQTLLAAASAGHLSVLRWAMKQGCPGSTETKDILWAAGSNQHILRWVFENTRGNIVGLAEIPLGFMLGTADRDLLLLAREKGLTWDASICNGAARDGNLELLKWLHENGCPWEPERIMRAAADGGNLETLKWLKEQGCPWSTDVCAFAARSGHLHILQWVHELGCPWDKDATRTASSLSVLKWLHENGCPWDQDVCSSAAEAGDLEMLRYARQNGCPWDTDTTFKAAFYGHLEVLEWALENGCEWDIESLDAAAKEGHAHVLRWALERGQPWRPTWLLNNDEESITTWGFSEFLAREPLWAILRLLRKAGHPWCTRMFAAAAALGFVEVLKWLHHKGCPWDFEACTAAAEFGHLEALDWLHRHGCPWDAKAFAAAATHGRLAVVHYLHANDCPWDKQLIRRPQHLGAAMRTFLVSRRLL